MGKPLSVEVCRETLQACLKAHSKEYQRLFNLHERLLQEIATDVSRFLQRQRVRVALAVPEDVLEKLALSKSSCAIRVIAVRIVEAGVACVIKSVRTDCD
jgi:hypothetical protein